MFEAAIARNELHVVDGNWLASYKDSVLVIERNEHRGVDDAVPELSGKLLEIPQTVMVPSVIRLFVLDRSLHLDGELPHLTGAGELGGHSEDRKLELVSSQSVFPGQTGVVEGWILSYRQVSELYGEVVERGTRVV